MDCSFKVLVIIGIFVTVSSVTCIAAVIDANDSRKINHDVVSDVTDSTVIGQGEVSGAKDSTVIDQDVDTTGIEQDIVSDAKYSTDIKQDPKIEITETKQNVTTCHLRQTMAWSECRHIKCPVTCQGLDDCTFPYCDSLGQCTCRPASCQTARTCSFFRINCTGHFTCKEGSCFCEK